MSVASTSRRSPRGVPDLAPQSRSTSASAASWSFVFRIGLMSFAMLHRFHVAVGWVERSADPTRYWIALFALASSLTLDPTYAALSSQPR